MDLSEDSLRRLLERSDGVDGRREVLDGVRRAVGVASIHMRVVDTLRQPVVLMSPAADVHYLNDAARELLDRSSLVRVQHGKLVLPPAALQELLQRCAELQAAAGPAGRQAPGSGFHALRVRGAARHDRGLYAFFTFLAPRAGDGMGAPPVAMLVFHDPVSAPSVDSSLLHALFGLTPAEARIAGLLADGLSLKEIAQQQGTQHETVRKQLRSIYLKTATNRQQDLVRLLLHLPHMSVQD